MITKTLQVFMSSFSLGTAVVSSINHGLYVVKPDFGAINAVPPEKYAYGEQVRMRMLLSKPENTECPHLVETKQCEVKCAWCIMNKNGSMNGLGCNTNFLTFTTCTDHFNKWIFLQFVAYLLFWLGGWIAGHWVSVWTAYTRVQHM